MGGSSGFVVGKALEILLEEGEAFTACTPDEA